MLLCFSKASLVFFLDKFIARDDVVHFCVLQVASEGKGERQGQEQTGVWRLMGECMC